MNRKIVNSQEHQEQIFTTKRTTIYLPEHLLLHKPIKEINKAFAHTHTIIQQLKDRKSFLHLYRHFYSLLFSQHKLKGFQINVMAENRANLYKIKQLTGWSQSQVTLICFAEKIKDII
ncbi:hypothetical protein [Pseudobacillus wudalianchiensis]|uniref:Uncharacterized protein n=1 Tax=Pseudobacillus wudalianchiensis TaxID=1743143 RepID=A0A1B9AZ17_9BACI|nr:hypothetical protein [Bacillus wudalianchiensis]OCA89026.1 hypothetical protein A8F95_06325 [Bacillus wudalianchiensis]